MGRSVHFIAHHDRENAVTRYRCLNLIEQLESAGWTAKFSYRYAPGPITIDEDVIVLNRVLLDDPIRELIERLKAAGKAVVFGVDDLIFSGDWADKERAEAEPRLAEAVWRETMGYVEQSKETMMLCDSALVSTQYLAERSTGLGKEAALLRNTLSNELWLISQGVTRAASSEKVVLGYFSGTRTHNLDFDSIAAPLARVLENFAQAELMIVGPVATPALLLPFENRVDRRDVVEWRQLPAMLVQVDINLAPLDLSLAFNHGKSHLKWLESAAVGVPTVASRTLELSSSIDEGVDGFTAVGAEDWFNAIGQLIQDRGLRESLGAAALAKVGREYTASAQVGDTAAVFESIAAKFGSGVLESVTFAGYEEPGFFAKGIRKLMRAFRGG
ncbi:MAG TPA: glycosyltransferase [Fimbriimonadaceae bacterium]|jgi:glycosyltransferase involved in cell wall biosynthesis